MMVDYTKKYKKEVRHQLHCSRSVKKRVMDHFEVSLANYMNENPISDIDEVYAAFGPPEKMAEILMDEVSQSEKDNFQKQMVFKKSILIVIAIVFLILTIYVYFIKEIPLSVVDEGYYNIIG